MNGDKASNRLRGSMQMEPNTTSSIPAALRASLIDIWAYGFLGITVGQLVLAMLILSAAMAVRRLFGYVILKQIRYWSKRTSSVIDDAIVEALAPPIRFIPIIVATLAISTFLVVPPQAKEIFGEINRSLVGFSIFWGLFAIVVPVGALLDGRKAAFSRAMVGWGVRVAKVLVLSLGAAVILEIWGIRVGPFLAGFGLVGVAVALGAQDLFKNLIAGIFIIGEQRFRNGDWILVDGIVEGTVEVIGLRTTKVRRFDMAPVFVPNSKLADNALTNFSQMTYRRISWIIGLDYHTTVDQLRQIRDGIESHILGDGDFVQPPEAPTFVRIASFSTSSIDVMVYCFTRTTEWGEWLKIKEALAYALKEVVAKTGADFASPGSAVYVETMPAGTEVFPLQQQQSSAARPGPAGPQPSQPTTHNGDKPDAVSRQTK
ncbi:mechanosensitive ion channel family protein [Mesorhizobium sp. B2-4-12]|uniref:mechanosensitive ion channel family protein n=1 Tax=Mesorhizobium sp. B2-4-12 TaxID=2589937 RepID=UPI001AEE55BD|nr:mechanosensitive ion channel family protein [Mesorhizobium sp. B2-4-12]